jgi:hypothetical protein
MKSGWHGYLVLHLCREDPQHSSGHTLLGQVPWIHSEMGLLVGSVLGDTVRRRTPREWREHDWADGGAEVQCESSRASANPTRSCEVRTVLQGSHIEARGPGLVTHTYNLSYSGGLGRRLMSSSPTQAKLRRLWSQKIYIKQRSEDTAELVEHLPSMWIPEFSLQCHQNKKRKEVVNWIASSLKNSAPQRKQLVTWRSQSIDWEKIFCRLFV